MIYTMVRQISGDHEPSKTFVNQYKDDVVCFEFDGKMVCNCHDPRN